MKVKTFVYGALLTALALVIPLMFGGFLRIYIPPFSATLASHVPMILSMLLGPFVAAMVGIGSTLGFLIVLGPVIAARAAVHILVGVVGAYLIKSGRPFLQVALLVTPIHAIGEALVVIPFGFGLYDAGVVVGIGTILHYLVDVAIAFSVYKALQHASINIFNPEGENQGNI
ncbi:MAG: hypothetical protein UMV23_06255 [Halanaerobium sp.]|nr:hypothetical protein [Halanaerobium sp.]